MPEWGIFVYTKQSSTTAALGTGNTNVNGNGFVAGTAIKGVVVVPSYFDNLRVVSILTYATRHCNEITELILPNTITTLKHAALTAMDGLKEVKFPASIITIEGNNDYYTNAEKIYFAKGSRVVTIGANFIRVSKTVKEFTFPYSVQSIGASFADCCTCLERVYFCGSTDMSSISNAFSSCPNFQKVFVSIEYQADSFGGKGIEKSKLVQCFYQNGLCLTMKCKYTRSFNPNLIMIIVIMSY